MSVNASGAVVPVILCGGSGTRLWPASTVERPKQFVPLVGNRSGFQDALARGQMIAQRSACVVVGGAAHRALIEAQAGDLGAGTSLLLEPGGRDSAAAMAVAAVFVTERDEDAVMVVLSADHAVRDLAGFAATIRTAVAAARRGAIVTLGISPTAPSTAFGYIRSDPAAGDPRPVLSFVEKPDLERARLYVAEGYLWNSGIFVVLARTLLSELQARAPEVLACARAAVSDARREGDAVYLAESFLETPRISIDYAVMEKTERAEVVTARFDWSDIGAWQAVWSASDHDQNGNVATGETVTINGRNVLVRAGPGIRLAVVGLSDVAVIAEEGAVLVCALDHSQAVKSVAQSMAASPARPFDDLRSGLSWFDLWMRTCALPLWWALGADHERGGFHERLDLLGKPLIEPRRLRVQARQAFVYAVAGEKGWPGPWRDAAAHALLEIDRRYRRPDGLYRSWDDPAGEVGNQEARTYDQAFVLLALAAARRSSLEDQDWAVRARALRDALDVRRVADGAFVEIGDRPFQANANMHMFEAALAWAALDPAAWGDMADGLGEFALAHFIDPDLGIVREVFDARWAAAPGEIGRLIEPGHQFEWAWLLDRWAALRGHDRPRAMAQRLFRAGARGVNTARGVAVNALRDDFTAIDSAARLWPQTERLRTSLLFDDAEGALSALGAIHRYLNVSARGVWRDCLTADGVFATEAAPASSLYHLVSAWREIEIADA